MNAAAISNQKSVPLIPVAADLLPNKNRVELYRSLIGVALKEKLPLLEVNIKNMERDSIFLNPLLSAKINLIAEEHKITFQQAFAGLTAAGIEHLSKARAEIIGIAAEVKAPFDTEDRPEQLVYYQGIRAGLNQNKIVLAEASTGTGKGRALCAAAIDAANQDKTPVIIAAPTLKVLGQLWSEMSELRQSEKLGQKLSFGFFPGATEFVNEVKLEQFMQTHIEDPDVTEWINNNGHMLESENPLREAMHAMGVKPSWLMEDLRTLAVNMPADDFSLRNEDECETTEILGRIREQARNSDIIFCTHTMLAISHMVGWSLAPEPAVLIIDEAHQFEQNIASIYSNRISMFSLINRLAQQSKSPGKVVKAVRDFIFMIREIYSDSSAYRIDLSKGNDQNQENIMIALEIIAELLKSRSHNDVNDIGIIRKIISDTLRTMNGETQSSASLTFSPDRRFPSIMSGKSDIRAILGSLWKTAQGGIVLASATLYIQDQYGDYKADYIDSVLALPPSRVFTFPPIISEWVTSVPVLHIPTPEHAERLARPTRSENQTIEEWLNTLVDDIKKIVQKTEGGTLILTTSYDQVKAISEGLHTAGIPRKRLITQQQDKKLAVTEQEFRQAHAEGLRPIWIALGAAWTGLDLQERKENRKKNEDTLLTDLIIACSPVGLNRTNTMEGRIYGRTGNINLQPIIKEALMMFKQGLGRLMRSGTQKNRHIWILDGRIWSKWEGMENFQKSVEKMLRLYKNREFIR